MTYNSGVGGRLVGECFEVRPGKGTKWQRRQNPSDFTCTQIQVGQGKSLLQRLRLRKNRVPSVRRYPRSSCFAVEISSRNSYSHLQRFPGQDGSREQWVLETSGKVKEICRFVSDSKRGFRTPIKPRSCVDGHSELLQMKDFKRTHPIPSCV